MIHYILQTIFFQLIFLLAYELLLKKETFFSYNRSYLLFTPVLCMLLPLLNVPLLQKAIPAETFVLLPEIIIGSAVPNDPSTAQSLHFDPGEKNVWWMSLYLSGVFFSFCLFLRKFLVLRNLKGKEMITNQKGLRVIRVPNTNIACTFLNTIYLGEQLSEEEIEQILPHELVHVNQRHSLDLLFFELQRVLFWFNPLVYLYQARLAELHEYAADARVVKTTEKREYFNRLLNRAFGTHDISFINQFFNHSIIKKRIVMLQKSRSRTLSKIKYLIMVPLVMLMLTYVACSEESDRTEAFSEMASESEDPRAVYREELIQMQENGASFAAIHAAFMPADPRSTLSEEEFYRMAVLMEDMIRTAGFDAGDKESQERMITRISRSYEQYLSEKGKGTITPSKTQQENSNVPFAVIEEVPVFPGCGDLTTNEERKVCMTKMITNFVNKNFDSSLGKKLGLQGINRIYTQFQIGKDGQVHNVRSRAPHPALEEEAIRVVNELPDFLPGKQNGEAVSVIYSLPITFQVN